MSKKFNKFIPNQILIDSNELKSLTEGHVKLDRWIDAFWAFFGAAVSSFITYRALPADESVLKNIWLIATIILAAGFSVSALLFFLNKKNLNPYNLICQEAIKRSKYTLVFIVVDGNGDAKRYLSRKSTAFLPYADVPPTNDLFLSDDELKEEIVKTLKIGSDEIISYEKLNKDGAIESIKPKDEGNPRLICFDYYWIQLRESCKGSFSQTDSVYTWKPLSELMLDPDAIFSNHDVIKYLRDHDNVIKDSFEKKRPLKIIWNITRECGLNCSMCATHSTNRKELDLSQKRQVLENLLSSNIYFTEFDFAGGDPLFKPESRVFILMAIKLIKNFSITTTYRGVSELINDETIGETEKNKLLDHCELTIDSDNSDSVRGENNYSDENYAIIAKIVNRMRKVSINIPITKTDLNGDKIRVVAERINGLDIRKNRITVNLLRLMPVGRFSLDKYPDNYDPLKYITEFSKYIHSDINVNIHCALRGAKCDLVDNCGMGQSKIGIDEAGNVFACAWAGYISSKNIVDNPFYLGNLTEQSLIDILQLPRAVRLAENAKTHQDGSCRIFSYEQTKGIDIFSTKDSLLSAN